MDRRFYALAMFGSLSWTVALPAHAENSHEEAEEPQGPRLVLTVPEVSASSKPDLPIARRLELWLDTYAAIVDEGEPAASVGAETDWVFQRTLDLSSQTVRLHLDGYFGQRRPLYSCVAGADCRNHDSYSGVRVNLKERGYVGVERNQELFGFARSFSVIGGSKW